MDGSTTPLLLLTVPGIHVSNQNSSIRLMLGLILLSCHQQHGAIYLPEPKLFGGVYNKQSESSGEVGELLLFDRVLSESERQLIEGYLANKWNLSIPSSHAFSTWTHGSINTAFSQDSASGTGMSLDTSNGIFVEVPTGGTEDTFDGGSAFSVSMWMKGWPTAAGESIIGKDNLTHLHLVASSGWMRQSRLLSKDGTVNPPPVVTRLQNGMIFPAITIMLPLHRVLQNGIHP